MRRFLEWFFSWDLCVVRPVSSMKLSFTDFALSTSLTSLSPSMDVWCFFELSKKGSILWSSTTLANNMLQTASNYMKHNSKCHTNLDTFPPLHFLWQRDRLYRSHCRRSPDGFKVFIHGWCIYQQNFVQSCLRHHKPTQKTPFCC